MSGIMYVDSSLTYVFATVTIIANTGSLLLAFSSILKTGRMSFHHQHALSCVLLVVLTSAIPLVKDVDVPLNISFGQYNEPINYRLSKDVFPRKYTIRLEPNIVPGQFMFKGETEIEIYFQRRILTIVLHAVDLVIDEDYTKLLYADGSKVNVSIRPVYDRVTEFYKLNLNKYVPSGNYILKMKYTGIINDNMMGFYRSSYVNDQGEKVWLATTHFEPTEARRAFPCFDEPSFKATFKIFITHLDKYTAVSNMPAISKRRPENDKTKWITEFQETQKMSTYLVAFVVSDFKNLSNSDGSFRVFASSNKIHLGRFAQAIGPNELAELAKYTKIDYKLPKIDNFAIPQSFFEAMENWGLVTYNEIALLYDENHTTTMTKQAIAGTMSHEYAHQWFGNLVTPSWWSFIWLSEGFATYFQFWIVDQIEPSWRMMEQFVTAVLQDIAFTADDYEFQHAMEVTVNSASECSSIFDGISYAKASSVIRMFVHVLTPTVFQTGLQNYLTNKSYQTVTSDDLIRELVTVGKDIEFLDKALVSWIRQPGYPVITVTRNHTTGSAVISQRRFLTNAIKPRTELWFVPINVVSEEEPKIFSETKPTYWLLDDNKTLTLSGFKNDGWIILNSQQTGYYRVNYNVENWQLIIDYLKNPNTMKNIHVLNRAQLLDDSFHLAPVAILTNYSIFLEMTKYLQHEEDYIPWYAAHRAFGFLNKVLANTGCYDLFKLYIQRLTAKLEKKLGYTEKAKENDDVKMNRLNVIRMACAMGSTKCLAVTHEMLVEHVDNSNKTAADLQSVVLCAGMRSANREEWEKVYNYTTKLNNDSDEHRNLLNSLGCSSDPEILKIYLERALLTESDVIINYAMEAACSSDVAGVDVVLAFINSKFQYILDKYKDGTIMIYKHLMEIAIRMTTQEQIARLRNLIEKLPSYYVFYDLKDKAVSAANKNIEWVRSYERTVATFLDAQNLVEEQNHKGMQHHL